MAGRRRFIVTTLATVLVLSTGISRSHVQATEALNPPTAGLQLGAERRPEPEPDFDDDPEGLLHPSRFGRPITRIRPVADPRIYANVRLGQTEGGYVDMTGMRNVLGAAVTGNGGVGHVRVNENTREPVADGGGLLPTSGEPHYENTARQPTGTDGALNDRSRGPEAQARGNSLPDEPYYVNIPGQSSPNQGRAGANADDVTERTSDEATTSRAGSWRSRDSPGQSTDNSQFSDAPDWASTSSRESFYSQDTDEELKDLSSDDEPFEPSSVDVRYRRPGYGRSQPFNDDALLAQLEDASQASEVGGRRPSGDLHPPYEDVSLSSVEGSVADGEESRLRQDPRRPSDGEISLPDIQAPEEQLPVGNRPSHLYESVGRDRSISGSSEISDESSHIYETIPPSLPQRNAEMRAALGEASHGVAAGNEVVEYVYLCSTRKVSDIKEMGGVFPRGYRPHESLPGGTTTDTNPNFQFDEYFHGAEPKSYVVAYRELSDAAQVASDWPAGGKVRIWKVKTTPNMFPESSILASPAAEGERFLAFGGVHKGQMAGYYKLSGRETAEQMRAIRNGVPPKTVGVKYVKNRGYRAQPYENERHVLASEITDDKVVELRRTLNLPACPEQRRSGGPSKRSAESCVWRESVKDLEGEKDADPSEVAEEEDVIDLSGEQVVNDEKPEGKVTEAEDMNLWEDEKPAETSNKVDFPVTTQETEAMAKVEEEEIMALARFERGELEALADGLATHFFTDLVKRLKLKLPDIGKDTAHTATGLRKQLAQVASIKTWSSSRVAGGSLTIAAAVTTSYVYDLVRTWRDKEATRLDKMVVSLALVPMAGCSAKVLSDERHGAVGSVSTSLCFVADALLFTPLAPLSLFIHAVRGVVDRIEQQSIEFIISHHDAGWRDFYDNFERELESDDYRSGVANRYATELSVIAFDASEQLGMLEAGMQMANKTSGKQLASFETDNMIREREEALKKMCGSMRYKKLWYDNWLAVNMSHYVRQQAADYTARFMEQQTSQALQELEAEQKLAIAHAVRYPQPPERAKRREEEVKAKLKHLAIKLGIMKREEVEDYARKAMKTVSEMVRTLNFTRPAQCDCPTLVEEIDLLAATDGSREELEHGLRCSAARGYDDVVERILTKALFTVDVNCVDEEGNSALLLATARRRSKIVDMLLRIGHADPDVVNKRGETVASLEAKAKTKAKSVEEEKLRRSRRIDTTMPGNNYTTKGEADVKKLKRTRRIDTSMP
ncbi:hypothetical protein CP532_2884 [Ophiocordyceps camponoti-leonardi (nom. inval.)]|nr:hypothetical protein CP532_2884 [Ophiocordyceps camponoti-leonardi (nom. inval.)]